MESSEIIRYVLAFVGGAAVSVVYFGALWLTVKRMMDAKRPAVLFAGSFLLRVVFALGSFYLIMDGRWQRLAVALAGFILVRLVVVRRYLPLEKETVTAGEETG